MMPRLKRPELVWNSMKRERPVIREDDSEQVQYMERMRARNYILFMLPSLLSCTHLWTLEGLMDLEEAITKVKRRNEPYWRPPDE